VSEPLSFPSFEKPCVRVALWEAATPPSEETLRGQLSAEGYGVVRWQNEPRTGYPPHAHIYPETLWVITGSVSALLPAELRILELLPGDRVELPAGMLHAVVAGPEGAAYLLATR
jgi:quercetin dioxygenase-like cupin family protein